MLDSVCSTLANDLPPANLESCNQFLGGILEKGLKSANLAFWDNIRELKDSYFKTPAEERSEYAKELLNYARLVEN